MMAESLLLPVVRAAAGKAADALVKSVAGMWGVDDDRDKLERQLLAVQSKLVDAEVKSETNQYVKKWMKDFRAVAYEADDVLDDFQYEALRRETQIGESTSRKVLSYITSRSPLLFRFAMSRKLKNVLEKINKLVVEMNLFGLQNCVPAEAPQVPSRQTHSKLDESADIFGRDDDKEEVVNLLLNQQDHRKVQVLPIFGMGGLGKTTLAKMVYNDSRVLQHFQLKMWHCASENFEAIALVKSIIELAANGRCDLPDTIELLRKRLEEVIGRKRFLLVLDDVWNEEKKKWEDELKPLLCSVGGPGSVIVVSCRSKQVADIMCTLRPLKLACLSEDDSWKLFSKKAFSNGVEEQAELVTIGRRIVNKCRGLPLALKTMGGLMSSKQQIHEWEAIEESNIGDNVGGKAEILPMLKLSYRHLSYEMKQCFAFCAVFPKDHEMDKDVLIQLWMANGFIQEEKTMDPTQRGESIFHDLVRRSFLQDVKAKTLYFNTQYESIGCKMHDLMHDLAKDVTDECASIKELIQQKALIKDICHMQVSVTELKQISGLFKGKTSLRTLLAPLESHKDLKELRQVSIRALRSCSSSIINCKAINAKHLRYLDLSGSSIVKLPDSICVLYSLQSLRLNRCWLLQQLPEYMRNLRKLTHLYLVRCEKLERMPPNIGLLNNLHTLTTFVVDTGDGRGIEELKDLRHLGNSLELYNLRKIKSGKNAKEADLQQKQNLSELLFCWGRGIYDEPEDEACNEEEVLQCLAPHKKIQIFGVHGYGGLEISQWMRDPQMFECLRKLIISNCPRCKNIPVVWLSVSLEYLSLYKMGNLTTLCNNLDVEAGGYSTPLQIFPKLREMVLDELPCLERWAENSAGEPDDSLVMFPLLQVLTIENCPKLASVPVSPILRDLSIIGRCSIVIGSLAHFTTLSMLRYEVSCFVHMSIPLGSWPSLISLSVSSLASMMIEDQQRPMEKLESLRLEGPNCFVTTPGLSRSHLMLWECFAFVKELEIQRCNGLVRWPMEELRSFARLCTLRISFCNNLEGKGSSSEEETLPLPQLERLSIENCRGLLEILELPVSLEELKVSFCASLVALPWNLGDLAQLRDLRVRFCSGLKALPHGMDGLTSLERLLIVECPGIEEFPQGLLQRLPALKSLEIWDCPELQRRCREGGEYFHLVSSIPDKEIPAAPQTESSRNKFLRRFH